jgi:hypothetical protein
LSIRGRVAAIDRRPTPGKFAGTAGPGRKVRPSGNPHYVVGESERCVVDQLVAVRDFVDLAVNDRQVNMRTFEPRAGEGDDIMPEFCNVPAALTSAL